MVPLRRRMFACALSCALTFGSSAGPFVLPPIDGEISGTFAALKLTGAPKLRWTIAAHTGEAGLRSVTLTIDGEGTRFVARGAIDARGTGKWRIEEGRLDVAAWFPSAANEIGEMAQGVAMAGELSLSGGGEIDQGQPRGVVRVEWRNGWVRHEADGWSLDEVAFAGEFAIDAAASAVKSTEPFELTVRTISTTRFGARALSIRGEVREDRTLALNEARIEVAGGEVTTDATSVTLDPLAVELNLRITNVGLQDVAALVPAGVSESNGRINGAVRIAWTEEGFKLGAGNLVLGEAEPAMLRLAPAPGFLTDHVPERLSLLPDWLGPVAGWFRPRNPAYVDMRDIELGRTHLQVEGLSIQLTPEGDSDGRTARVRVTARPAKSGSVVELVTFEINVAGPLSEVLRLGLNQSFSIGTR